MASALTSAAGGAEAVDMSVGLICAALAVAYLAVVYGFSRGRGVMARRRGARKVVLPDRRGPGRPWADREAEESASAGAAGADRR